jgi:uncharacterized protein (TIGR03663 family)
MECKRVEATDLTLDFLEEEAASPWTVERAAWIGLGLLAAVVRFFQLGLRPLNEVEALQALAAYRFSQGAIEAAPAGTVPALFSGNVVGFSLFGASDISARWLPALAGLILVLLPYGLRHRLGRGGALAASLLLALSPAAVYFSRALDGVILVAACGLAIAVGLINYLDSRRPAYAYLAAGALGLGLCAGPAIWTLVLIFAAFGLLLYLAEKIGKRESGWSSLLVAWWALRGESGLLAQLGAVLAATFGLVAMTFVLHPAGVGQAADLLGGWLVGFWPESGGNPALYPIVLLLRYEALVLVLGLVEIGRALWAARSAALALTRAGSAFPHTTFLTFWAAAAALVILIAGHRPAGNILLVVVPLALLAGQGVARAWRWLARRHIWAEAWSIAGIALVLGVFLYLQIASYSLADHAANLSFAGLSLPTSSAYLLLALIGFSLLVGLGAIAWAWRGPALLLGGGWLTLLVVLGLFGFQAMWGLNVAQAADPRQILIAETTRPEVRLFVEELESLSLAEVGDAHLLPITVDADTGPVVAWYLREFERQSVVKGLADPPGTVAAITLAAQDLPIGETFRGQGFPLRAWWTPWGIGGQPMVRWLLFNAGYKPFVDQEVVLWVNQS